MMPIKFRYRFNSGSRSSFKKPHDTIDHISSYLVEHGFHISNMKPEFVKVQKHCINESFLVTIPYTIAQAISITKGDVMKTVLDGKRVIMEKV